MSVTAALFRKELRDQRAFLVLAVLFVGGDVLDVMHEQLDMHSLGRTFHDLHELSSFIIQGLFGFAIGTGLWVRERDEGTLAFLDGLPVTRARVLGVKLAAASSVLMVYPTFHVAYAAALHLWGRDSLSHAFQLPVLLTIWGLLALLTFVALAFGCVVAPLRSLAWATAGATAVGVRLLALRWPAAAILNPFALIDAPVVGTHWHLSGTALLVQGGLALACTGLCFAIAASPGSVAFARLAAATRRPVLSALVMVLTGGVFVGLCALVFNDSDKPEGKASHPPDEVPGATFSPSPAGFRRTAHYTFSYPANGAAATTALAEAADATFERVERVLPSATDPPIDVDLSGSMANTGGTAFWNRIRMDPHQHNPVGILAHETTHVLSRRRVVERARPVLDRIELWNEGFAHWMEYDAPGGERVRDEDELLVAAVLQRRMLAPGELFDPIRLAGEHDINLRYALGATLTRAMVARYGEGAPARLLEAFNREDFPRSVEGYALWQALFQLAEMDLPLVIDDLWRMARSWTRARAAQLAALPRPRAITGSDEKYALVRVVTDRKLPAGWHTLVRFRPAPDSDLERYRTAWTEAGVAKLPRQRVAQATLCFQPGLVSPSGTTLYEPWRCVPLEEGEP